MTIRVKTNRSCDFNIPTGTRYDDRCRRPAKWKWHDQDDEMFCDMHKDGVPDEYDSEDHYNKFWSTH